MLKRISSHANWEVPSHMGMSDLEFDPHDSLGYAFTPTWGDPLIFGLSLLHIFAYGYFAFLVADLHHIICGGVFYGLLTLLPAAYAIQVGWAIKAVYIMDKAANSTTSVISFFWRVFRTSLLTLVFSYSPAWVVGCLAWPFIRIDVHGGSNFYDQSLVIGQYVQNSAWYIGGRGGSLSENIGEYSEMTIRHRSRYWDAAGEQAVFNVGGFTLICIVCYVMSYVFGENASVTLFGLFHLTGFDAIVFWGALALGVFSMIVNTTGLAAISILEFSKIENALVPECDLSPDGKGRWMLYLPHAVAGVVLYAALFYFVFYMPIPFLCKAVLQQ